MKLVLIFILLSFINLFSQKIISPSVEIFIGTKTEQGYTAPINISLTKQAQVWGVQSPVPPNYDDWSFYKTNEYDSPAYTVTVHNQNPDSWGGLDFVSSQQHTYQVYGYGLYKITNSINSNAYFYIDYRDRRIGRNDYAPQPIQGIDIAIKYDKIIDKFLLKVFGASGDFEEIENGALKRFWEMEQAGPPETDSFPDFWENCLASIEYNSNLRLVWGKERNTSATKYRLFRLINESYTDPQPSECTWIYESDVNTFDFIDNAVYNNINSLKCAHYFVESYNGASFLGRTNIVLNEETVSPNWNSALYLTISYNI